MSKFIVKTKLSGVKKEDGQFSWREEIVSMKWDAKAQRDAVQSGKGPGEFGPDYSDRKQYQMDYHDDWENPTITPQGKPLYQVGHGNESPSPVLKNMLESIPTGRDPFDARKQSQYEPHVIEPYDAEERKKKKLWKGLI